MTKALKNEIESIEQELQSLLQDPDEVVEVKEDDEAEIVEAEPAQEDPKEESVKEDVKEPELDASGYRRLRLEKEAEKRRADELERKISELQSKLAEPKEEYSNTERQESPVDYEIERIKLDNRYNAAEKVLLSIENQFKQAAPEDYDDVALQYKATIYKGIQVENPDMDHMSLLDATRRRVLEIANNHKARGYDPIEKMYLDGKRMGFSTLPREQATEKEVVLKPDLDKIAANKRRNANTVGAKGSSDRGQMTASALSELSAAEYAKIPKSERIRIINSLATE